MAKVHLILEKWIRDKVIQLPPVLREPSPEDRVNPRYCQYHRHLRHPTKDCWSLRRMFEEKYQLGELIFQEEEGVNRRPFPEHEGDTARVHVFFDEDDSFIHTESLLGHETRSVESYTEATLLEAAQGLTVTLASLTPMIAALQDTQKEMKLTLTAISQYIGSKESQPKGRNETSSLLNTSHEANSYITKSEFETMLRDFVSPNVHRSDTNPSYSQDKTHGKGKEGDTSQHVGQSVGAREAYPPNRSMGINKRGPPERTYDIVHKRTKVICDKKKEGKEGKIPPPPFQCSMEQVHLVLDAWIRDGVVNFPPISKEPSAEDKASPRYCRYHRHLRHPTKECWTLQKLFDNKYKSGEFISQG